mmetsp:Transcript_71500/g.221787  ORF Transcript_71500/g.221787 Transcript_71500/m.221787 type:complete len:134 (+) Transcript_71500:466-867(+)
MVTTSGPAAAAAAGPEEELRLELEALRSELAVAVEGTTPPPLGSTSLGRQLSLIASGTRPFLLEPRALFVAWSGVITLAYAGWPPQAVAAKARFHEVTGSALAPEQPGSRWPKTTLGALREDRVLTLEELERW